MTLYATAAGRRDVWRRVSVALAALGHAHAPVFLDTAARHDR